MRQRVTFEEGQWRVSRQNQRTLFKIQSPTKDGKWICNVLGGAQQRYTASYIEASTRPLALQTGTTPVRPSTHELLPLRLIVFTDQVADEATKYPLNVINNWPEQDEACLVREGKGPVFW